MRIAKRKRPSGGTKPARGGSNHRRGSFRELKAFGLWADRDDVKDAIQFTKHLRTQMEHGNDAQ